MLSANTALSQSWSGFTRFGRSPRPSASWMSAACTTRTPSSSPSVSTGPRHCLGRAACARSAASRHPSRAGRRSPWSSRSGCRQWPRWDWLPARRPRAARPRTDGVCSPTPRPGGRRACSRTAHVAVHGAPGREGRRRRQVPPLAAGAHEEEQAVQQVPHVRASRPPSRPGGRDQRFQQPELVIRQGLAGAKLPNQRAISRRPHDGRAISRRPHDGLQAGNRLQRRLNSPLTKSA
jgi:hypothetical protein